MIYIDGQQTVQSVKDAWLAKAPNNEPFIFTNAGLTALDLAELFNWAQQLAPRHMLLVYADGKLILRHKDPTLMRFQWEPITQRLL